MGGVTGGIRVSAPGLIVKLASAAGEQYGKGGAPLLDNTGTVACVTFQGNGSNEECLAASALAEALQSLSHPAGVPRL